MFSALKTGIFCAMDNCNCSVNIIGTALSSLPDPYLKSGLFDLILKPLKLLKKKSALIRL